MFGTPSAAHLILITAKAVIAISKAGIYNTIPLPPIRHPLTSRDSRSSVSLLGRHVRRAHPAMRKISTARSSRRAPPLKDSDYDHEINLVDHAAEAANPQAITPEPPLEPPAEAPSEPTASEEVEDPESDLSPRSTLDAGQNLSKYTTAVQSYAPGTPALQAGPSTTTREPSPCRSTNSHRSTSTSVDSSGKAKKARRTLKGSSLRRASRGRVTVPKVTVNGEYTAVNRLRLWPYLFFNM